MMPTAVPRGSVMRRPPNLMKTMTAARPEPAPADPGPPSNYLDLYGLSKPPFGSATDGSGFILFGSHRRAFELLVEHMMNGSGLVLLTGDSGIGKTETLRAAAAVAAESGLRTILISRPPEGRIDHEQIVAALDGEPETFFSPPRKALLADDIELMPSDCLSLLLSLARSKPAEPGGSAIILSSSGAEVSRPDLAELSLLARNTIRLMRLGPAEILQYVERSLWIAGGTTRRLITPDALKLVIARSGGMPGNVNRLMEAGFTAGFARGDSMITAKTVGSVLGPAAPRARHRSAPAPSGVPARALQIAAMGLLAVGASVFLYKGLTDKIATKAPPVVVQAPAEPPPPVKAAATLPPALMDALVKRGNEALDLGDIAGARLLFQRAAEAGNGAAATALGKTYDPNFTTSVGARDPARAIDWYRKAIAQGDQDAADLLKRLGSSKGS
jgi:type II secretory pathway predicted ATPase ExeA